MFEVGISEVFVIIVVAMIFLDTKDIALYFKNIRKFFAYLNKVKQDFTDILKTAEQEVTKDLDPEINFQDFKKEFLEPSENISTNNHKKDE